LSNTLDTLTDVAKVFATGALAGAMDAGAKVVGGGSKTETKVAGGAAKSKPSISNNKTATNKKTKSGK